MSIREKGIKKISLEYEHLAVMKDIQSYIELCLQKGADNAAVISQKEIFLDPRARMKCLQPKCMHYGMCANCPPHIPDFSTFVHVIKQYEYAVIYRCKMPLSKNTPRDRRDVAKIVKTVEGQAFSDGYYFAMGFGAGNCKKTWCPEVSCQALELGKGCRFPLESRVSMESAGFDVFKMVTNLGWDIYPIGKHCLENQVPFMNRVGIVLIK